jgi:TRAP-type C4-dicarboxylate transport system permease small subunit
MSEPLPQTDESTGMAVDAGAFGVAANVLAAIGTIWIFLLMFLIVADVVGRNFLDSPITGVAEIAARSVVAIVFLQIASAVLEGRMTRADFVVNSVNRFAPRAMRMIEVLFALVGAAVFAGITYASWPELADAWRTGEYFGVQGIFTIPTLPFRGIIVIGSIAAMVSYLRLVSTRAASSQVRS